MSTQFQLPNYRVLGTRQFDVAADVLNKAWRPHKGMRRLGVRNFEMNMYLASLSQMAFARVELVGGVLMDGGQLDELYTIAIPLEGGLRFRVNNQDIAVKGSTASFYSASQDHEISVHGKVKLLNLRISRMAFESELNKVLDRSVSAPVRFNPVLALNSDFGQQILRLLDYMVAEVNVLYPGKLEGSIALKQAERTLVQLLLEHQEHNYSLEMQNKDADPACWQVLRAEEYVRANLGNTLTVSDMASAAGVTERTLSRAFKRRRRCTPVQFIRQLKLEAVNHQLKNAAKPCRVTDVASQWGFLHPGHFSTHYLKHFGETASQTLKNSR
jgi:AraC-like DNA-binding protein